MKKSVSKRYSDSELLKFKKIIATPHTYKGLYDNDKESIKESYLSLTNSYDSEIDISFASEYMIEETLIEKAKSKNLLCLKRP